MESKAIKEGPAITTKRLQYKLVKSIARQRTASFVKHVIEFVYQTPATENHSLLNYTKLGVLANVNFLYALYNERVTVL